ncbi:glycosyltransferase family 4 protein [Clostridium beijerinckii]|uniref:glycosyltransferase family 4 protein n=1 Tax=Clostridium beijerinckii TaxID=1520 RepID=UPI00098C50DF|nr:glycosyltransferase family 1 protein [Clostridium beijerinckii]MBA8932540.1 glycosyltransferase involved in cell wall biosynthesis [Clostridium beijerinckii]NRU36744.1 glycosyltransferase involved in cell wall biosynthesis [Clostridium beijerinckii]NSA99977.1 glycosyltransferase involved in cell wall biosynthesis [Clostridium beijerinckii]OOM68952.1 D-inositol 3-phosphate glycosyltransferase [Clostridium beijerinckii]OOM69654.1 D-inositol 3-phosphate glycosyltransferase [Clostridium beijeri
MKISLELQPCLKNKSGIGIYTYELSKRLQEYNYITLYGDIFNFINRNNIEKDIDGLNFNKNIFSLFPYGVYRRMWNYVPIRYNWLFNDQSDIYHFFNFIVPPRIEGKVITTIHDMTYELYPETMDKKNLKRIKSDIHYSVNRADKIITVSESSKNDIMKFLSVDEAKIEIVYNGVEYDKFNKSYSEDEKSKIRVKYTLPKNYILYMGTLEPRKNIESIIEAFSLFKKENTVSNQNTKLVIAGKKGWLFENIFNLVNKLSLKDDVIFTDYIDENDKSIIYNMASLFVFPSLYEGFGIPVLEAMASSVPVITSNVSSLPEVAGDAAILVEPKDIKSIAKYMSKVLADKKLRNNLIREGHEQAKKFTWESSAKKLVNIYRDLYNK